MTAITIFSFHQYRHNFATAGEKYSFSGFPGFHGPESREYFPVGDHTNTDTGIWIPILVSVSVSYQYLVLV